MKMLVHARVDKRCCDHCEPTDAWADHGRLRRREDREWRRAELRDVETAESRRLS